MPVEIGIPIGLAAIVLTEIVRITDSARKDRTMQSITTRALYCDEWGEFSTAVLPDGSIETRFFADSGESVIVSRSESLRSVHNRNVAKFRDK